MYNIQYVERCVLRTKPSGYVSYRMDLSMSEFQLSYSIAQ